MRGAWGPCPGLLAGNPGEGSAPHGGVRSLRSPRRRLLPEPPGCPPVGSLRWLRGALGWPGGVAAGREGRGRRAGATPSRTV